MAEKNEENPANKQPLRKEFTLVEEQAKAAELEKKNVEAHGKTTYYFAPAKEYQLANWVPEKKDMIGGVVTREASLKFRKNILATTDPKMIKFVEASGAFQAGVIVKCESHEQAIAMSRAINMTRGNTEIMSEHTENVQINPQTGEVRNLG